MNFEKTYSSKFQNLFDSGGPGATAETPCGGRPGAQVCTSPKVDFENRPILSYTIPTNDCTSPGLRSKPSFSRRPVEEERRPTVRASPRSTRSGVHEGVANGQRQPDAFRPVSRSKTPDPEVVVEDSDRLARQRSFKAEDGNRERVGFVRASSARRSPLQSGPPPRQERSRPRTAHPSQGGTPEGSAQVSKEDFVTRIKMLRNRSKSVQRKEEEEEKKKEKEAPDSKVFEGGELLTEQTMPSVGLEVVNGVAEVNGVREGGMSRRSDVGRGSAVPKGFGTNCIRRSLTMNAGVKASHPGTIREGVTTSSSPTSSESDGRMFFGRCTQNSTPTTRRITSSAGQSASTSIYRDDMNNNYVQESEGKKVNQFARFGSLRVPKSSSSPLVKKRISFASDQNSEHSSDNDRHSVGSSEGSSEYRLVLENLNSSNWQSRRDGLSSLQMIIEQAPGVLSESDLKRISETFTKMFHDPHAKVCSYFLEVLPLFVSAYSGKLPHQWLQVCLNRLLAKCGSELLGSVQVKVKRALEVIRDSFTCDHHFEVMNSLVNNHTLMHNSKSRDTFVGHVRDFLGLVDPLDLTTSKDLEGLVSGLVGLLDSYQSLDLKKSVQAILLVIFDLSPPTFSSIMYSQPRNVQDFMTRIVKQHVSSLSARDQVSSSSSSSSLSFASSNHHAGAQTRDYRDDREYGHHHNHHLHQQHQNLESNFSSSNSDSAGPSMRNVSQTSSSSSSSLLRLRPASVSVQPDSPGHSQLSFQSRIPQRVESPSLGGSTTNVFSTPQVLRKVTLNRASIFGSSHLSRPETPNSRPQLVAQLSVDRESVAQQPVLVRRQHLLTRSLSVREPGRHSQSSRIGTFVAPGVAQHRDTIAQHRESDSQHRESVSQLRERFSQHRDSVSQHNYSVAQHKDNVAQHHDNVAQHREGAAQQVTDEEYLVAELDVFVEHFTGVNIDNKVEWKRVLKQLSQQLPLRPDLVSDRHLTSLMSVLLSAPEDIDECSLIVAECLTRLLKLRRIDQSLTILKGILDQADQSNVIQTLRWIKFQLDGVDASEIRPIMGELVESVLKTSDSSDKSVRTVSIMVLVQMQRLMGDDIWDHLDDINPHKKSLLQMYFRRPAK